MESSTPLILIIMVIVASIVAVKLWLQPKPVDVKRMDIHKPFNDNDIFDNEVVDKYVNARSKVHEDFGDDSFAHEGTMEPNSAEMGCVPDIHYEGAGWSPTSPARETQAFTVPYHSVTPSFRSTPSDGYTSGTDSGDSDSSSTDND